MDKKLALNIFNCHKGNIQNKIFNIKCKALPKQNRKENKELLKLIQELRKLK